MHSVQPGILADAAEAVVAADNEEEGPFRAQAWLADYCEFDPHGIDLRKLGVIQKLAGVLHKRFLVHEKCAEELAEGTVHVPVRQIRVL